MPHSTRRSLLQTVGALSLITGAATTGGRTDGRTESQTGTTTDADDSLLDVLSQLGPRRTLMANTRYETGVYVVESQSSTHTEPTAVVVAGQHGIEPAGWLTAIQLTGLTLETGKLVVVPFANPPAIVHGVYQTGDGNMNRQFPPGTRPTLDAAAAIWQEIQRHSPEVVLDLHSSHGIYESGVDSGLGQAVFPTAPGHEAAVSATEWVNDELVAPSTYSDEYEFEIGNVQGDPDRPLLSHKLGHDLDIPGYLVEVTREATTLSDRLTWQTAITAKLLEENGITLTT